MSGKSMAYIHTEDRISDLPDETIIHILSFVDAKSAVRTVILSKRFAFLWTEVRCLYFEGATINFTYKTLSSHKRLNLERVYVNLCSNGKKDPDYETQFQRIIELLWLANVKEFGLEFKELHYLLPQNFYSNPSFQQLGLSVCRIKTNGFLNWKSLQSLILDLTIIRDGTLNDILSGCPSLEFLELSRIWGFKRINLSSNKFLRKLVIDDCGEPQTRKIVAPYLRSLVFSGNLGPFRVLNAKSLTDCTVDFYDDGVWKYDQSKNIKMLTSLLEDLSHVEVVTIGEWVVQILSMIELNKCPCPMPNAIKCLTIQTAFTNDDLTGITFLLRNLNRLETLSIELCVYHGEDYFLPLLSGNKKGKNKSYWSKNKQSKVDLKLKKVEISYLLVDEFAYDMNELLLKFLLKNANVSENMTINAQGSQPHSFQNFANKLSQFQRSSSHALITVIG